MLNRNLRGSTVHLKKCLVLSHKINLEGDYLWPANYAQHGGIQTEARLYLIFLSGVLTFARHEDILTALPQFLTIKFEVTTFAPRVGIQMVPPLFHTLRSEVMMSVLHEGILGGDRPFLGTRYARVSRRQQSILILAVLEAWNH